MKISRPVISVIIPPYNEEKHLPATLDSLLNQSSPKDKFEIILVDGDSKDATLKIASNYAKQFNLQVYENPHRFTPYAFNIGVEKSKGDFFCLISAHCHVEKNYLEKAYKSFLEIGKKEPKLVCVGGQSDAIAENFLSTNVKLFFRSPFSGSLTFLSGKKTRPIESAGFGLYKKGVALQVGIFDPELRIGQDLEYNLKLRKRGFKVYYNPELIVFKRIRTNLRKLFTQTFNYGSARGIITRKYYFYPLWLVPSLFLTYLIALPLYLMFNSESILSLFLPLYFYLGLMFLFGIKYAIKDRCFLLAISFPIVCFFIHLNIGAGVIYGLIFKRYLL